MLKSFGRIIVLFLAFSFPQASFAQKYKVPILFVLYNAGETFALQPVMEELSKKGVLYKALVMGTARDLMKDRTDTLDLTKDCGVKITIDNHWPAEKGFNPPDLKKIRACVDARLVLTGMVAKAQLEVVRGIRENGARVYAYYDSLAPLDASSLSAQFVALATKVLVPSDGIARQVRALSPKSLVIAVGQPTLESWSIAKEQEDAAKIYARLPFLERTRKTVLYAGGYGDDYPKALTLFAQAASHLTQFNCLLSLHPKVDGSLERRVLKEVGADKVVIIPRSVSTKEAAVVSDLIVTQNSTVGVQALFMGKPALYLDVPGSSYKDVAISLGWAKQLFDVESFLTTAKSLLSDAASVRIDVYKSGEIPRHSANMISDLLVKDARP